MSLTLVGPAFCIYGQTVFSQFIPERLTGLFFDAYRLSVGIFVILWHDVIVGYSVSTSITVVTDTRFLHDVHESTPRRKDRNIGETTVQWFTVLGCEGVNGFNRLVPSIKEHIRRFNSFCIEF